jgi:type I restriction enzyme, S subunit
MNLNNIAEINPKTDVGHLEDDALVSFIPMSDLTDDGRWLGGDSRKLSSVRRGYTAFAENDVLFAKITPCMENGKGARVSNLSNGVGFGSTEYHVLRARSEEESEYVFQWSMFGELRGHAANAMTGSAGQQRVPADFLRNYPVFAHQPNERVAVGAVLRKLDHAIEQTEAMLVKQQRIKTGLMHDLLTCGLDAHGRLRDPSTHKFKKTVLGPVPIEWDETNIGTLATLITSGPRGWAQYYSSAGAKFIRIGNLTREHVNLRLQDMQFVLPPDGAEGNRTQLISGDVLFSITADLGVVGLVPHDFGPAYINQHIALIRPKPADIVSGWLANFLASHRVQKWISNINESGAKAGLNLPTIKSLPVTAPKPSEQQMIADILALCDRQIAEIYAQAMKLRRQKAGLMHDLLTGLVTVAPLLANPKAPISS